MLIELESVTKIYNQGQVNEVVALDDISLEVDDNSMICLRGASGCGKSTLLSIIGCVFQPTSGRVAIGGKQLSRLPDRFLTLHRRRYIGFIFQNFNILTSLTVRENIVLPLIPLGISPTRMKERAEELMDQFSISHRRNFPAGQVSGGELQRVAIARALVSDPPLILADEPTAHLDSRLGLEFMHFMADLKAKGKTIIITSHDSMVTEHPAIDRVIDMKDGRIHVP
ncbi:MAG: ABC transporter ATP-binding protein [Desulfobulbaceae bacterium]|nr:ABC transporter ATP-binding protein [Desulfobulbaceae bacterium]